jgi:predicted dithiol-disulfide oxidoreductase (DUF899 family)
MGIGRLGTESAEYSKLRDELQAAEIALRDQRERVAELRRRLPLDTEIEDQEFEEVRDGQKVSVRLSELFEAADKPLVLMHFMYGGAQSSPCPMCTMWADGYDGAIPHLLQRIGFVVFVAGDPANFEAYGRSRGWENVRVVSAAGSDLKRRLGFEDEEGAQHPGASVIVRQNGKLIHSYSVSAYFGEAGYRGMDLLSPVWNFFDLTPEGRGEFFPGKSYE